MKETMPELIVTSRLRLRPHSWRDVDDVFAFAADAEWARYLPVPQPYTRAEAEKFIARQLLLNREGHPSWAIEHAGTVIGGINIRFDFDKRLGEIGYSIARKFWGKGLTTEAAHAVLDAAFSTYADLNRIHARADARNTGSLRVMEKLGMTREGVLRQIRFVRGEFSDQVWCAILRSEWEAHCRNLNTMPKYQHASAAITANE